MASDLQVAVDDSLPERYVPTQPPYYNRYKPPREVQGNDGDSPNKEGWELEAHNSRKSDQDLQKHRLPFGWTPVVFALVVGVLTAVVVGAAVGGGIGGSLASHQSCDSNCSVSTSQVSLPATATTAASTTSSSATSAMATTALTDWTPPLIQDIQTLDWPCPGVDGQVYQTVRNQEFRMNCETITEYADLVSMWAYTFQDCIQACSSINILAPASNEPGYGVTTCQHVLYNTKIDGSKGRHWANCWLKSTNATVIGTTGDGHSVSADLIIS